MDKSIVYIGGGYVGLTGALHFAKIGFKTTIFDLDVDVVNDINKGTPKGNDFLSYLSVDVGKCIADGTLCATNDWNEVKNSPVYAIAVPSEKDGMPYDKIVIMVALDCIQSNEDNDVHPIIIIDSTLSPGVGNKIVKLASELGYTVGIDYYLAVCPRKDWFADPNKNLATLPRVVGGFTSMCTLEACKVLSYVTADLYPTNHEVAELTKALENSFLHVPSMLAHEMALARPDLNVAEAVKLAGLHWRLPLYYLGFGAGGRCLPGHEAVFIKSKEGLEAKKIGDIFNIMQGGEKKSFNILSRQDDNTWDFNLIERMGKRESPIVEISAIGRNLQVTPDHLNFVKRKINISTAQNILQKDNDSYTRIFPKKEYRDIITKTKDIVWSKEGSCKKNDQLIVFNGRLPFQQKNHTLNLSDYIPSTWKNSPTIHNRLIKPGTTANSVPKFISVTENFAELLGYYCSKGFVSYSLSGGKRFPTKKNWSSGLCFHSEEVDIINFCSDMFHFLGISFSTYYHKKAKSCQLTVKNEAWSIFIKSILGSDSFDCFIPSFIWESPDNIQRSFIKGVLTGDGYVSERNSEISFKSVSWRMNQELNLLLNHLGLKTSWKYHNPSNSTKEADTWSIHLGTKENRPALVNMFRGDKREKIVFQIQRDNHSKTNHGSKRHFVKNIKLISKLDYVYSIDVKDTENFVTSMGILTHNCVPLGTKYLIESTYEKNTSFTIGQKAVDVDISIRDKITDIAAKAWYKFGRAKKVLILGLGYRPNFKDVGLSPGLYIAKALKDFSVSVVVNDPLFTVEEIKKQFDLEAVTLEDFEYDTYSVILLATPHDQYIDMPVNFDLTGLKYVLDAQGTWRKYEGDFDTWGAKYTQVGDKNWTTV